MSKLTKIMHKIFGINADFSYQMGKFGSFKNGAPEYAANVSDIQSLANWETGLFDSVVANNAPLKEDINAVLHHTSRQVGYLYQAGIPEWDAGSTYYTNSFVSYGGKVYKSLQDSNANKIPNVANAAFWIIHGGGDLVQSASSEAFSQSVTTEVAVTGLSLSLTTSGRPVHLFLSSDPNYTSKIDVSKSGNQAICAFSLYRDAIRIADFDLETFANSNTGVIRVGVPVGSINHMDVTPAGTYTYSIKCRSAITCDISVFGAILNAIEV